MMRKECEKGFYAYFKRTHNVTVALTVKESLGEQIAKKLVQIV